MSIIRRARRANIPLKLGVSGPSGSGKTYSSILLAKGLMGGSLEKVVLLDTENGSGDLYSHLGEYSVLPFEPPFDPRRYAKAIDYCIAEGFECIIIDSISHSWDGIGGCLDIHSKIGGNSFTAWKQVTPIYNEMVNKILQTPVHIISCARKKTDYVLEENDKGKMAPKKVGLKDINREGWEYELSLALNLDLNHLATVSKDRTNLFDNGVPFKISEETGLALREWNNGN